MPKVEHRSYVYTYQSSNGNDAARETELNKLLEDGWRVKTQAVKPHSKAYEQLVDRTPSGIRMDKPMKVKHETSYVTVSVVLERDEA